MHFAYAAERRAPLARRRALRQRAPRDGARRARSRRSPRDGIVFASAVSETGQDLTRPATTATAPRTAGSSRAARSSARCRPPRRPLHGGHLRGDDGSERYGYAMVPRNTPGVVVHDDWDALGMRASGSHTVSFEDVRLPPSALRGGFPVGDATAVHPAEPRCRPLPRGGRRSVSRKARTRTSRARSRSDDERRRAHADAGRGERRRPRRLPRRSLARRLADRRSLRRASVAERLAPDDRRASSPRRRPPRCSSARPRCGSSTARSRSRAAPAT